jgi:hypothetical protein
MTCLIEYLKVGSTFAYGHGRGDDAKNLAELGFQVRKNAVLCYFRLHFLVSAQNIYLCCLVLQIGDYLSVAIM